MSYHTSITDIKKANMGIHTFSSRDFTRDVSAAKRAALEKAQTLDVAEAPVRAVLAHATVHWAE